MAGKNVAVEVKATPSTENHPADINKSGKWELIFELKTQPTKTLKFEKGALLFMAKANFIYKGGSVPSASGSTPLLPILAPTVKLNAKKTKLVEGGQPVLVEGDKIKDNFGNELKVEKVSGKLATT